MQDELGNEAEAKTKRTLTKIFVFVKGRQQRGLDFEVDYLLSVSRDLSVGEDAVVVTVSKRPDRGRGGGLEPRAGDSFLVKMLALNEPIEFTEQGLEGFLIGVHGDASHEKLNLAFLHKLGLAVDDGNDRELRLL